MRGPAGAIGKRGLQGWRSRLLVQGFGNPPQAAKSAAKAETASNRLSQVELRKLELARAMAARPRLLISDEAMAGLAGNEVDEVLKILFDLNATGITIIMIEHIMQAVMRFSQRVICLDAGRIICEGTPAGIVKNPDVQRAYLGA